MANPLYRHYSINDFDKYNCLKFSKSFYLALAFVLRGYLIWIMSVSNMSDRIGVLQFVYPQVSLFYLSLFSGALGLFIVFISSLRRPGAHIFIQRCWRHCRKLLVLAIIIDLIINVAAYYYWQMQSELWLFVHGAISFVIIYLLYKSKRFSLNLKEFPQDIEPV